MNDLQIKNIDFYGGEILGVKTVEGKIYMGVSKACYDIGLTESQKDNEVAKIQRDVVLKQGCKKLPLKFEGQVRHVLCIEIGFIPLWLAKISITPNMQKENPRTVERLVKYQLEAKDVLEQVFIEKKQPLKIDSKFMYQIAEQLEEKEKRIAEQKKEIEHKTEVIKGVTDDIDVYTKRNIINKVVRYKGANFADRWNELYDRFREVHSIDLKARCHGYNLKQKKKKDKLSVIKYAEKCGYIDDLYKIALKLYETDINEILKHLQKIA